MQDVYILAHNIISPLGLNSYENFEQVRNGILGVNRHSIPLIDDNPIWAGIIPDELIKSLQFTEKSGLSYTRFEQLVIASATDAIQRSGIDCSSNDTLFILSTTKGNIALLEEEAKNENANVELFSSAKKLSEHFTNPNTPLVVSNACISGVQAIITARRLIEAGRYKNSVVVGADTLSRFVYSGFKAFQALSPSQCRPFSADREGINLGEAAATVILSSQASKIRVGGGAISNDSNHISGPSRSGEELNTTIQKALAWSSLHAKDIGFISAHGTATPYNDEMESKAFGLSALTETPVHSLKGYFGHTLGAAGVLESIISILSLENNIITASAGFTTLGVPISINVQKETTSKDLIHCLKTASGFGGCNAALIFSKN